MKKNLMIATAFICCAMLSFAITGYAQADKTGNTGNDISDSVPTVEVFIGLISHGVSICKPDAAAISMKAV